MTGSVLHFLGAVVLVSIIVAILIALAVAQFSPRLPLGPFATGLIGVAACFVLAYLAFFLLDPDPMSEFDATIPLYRRTLPITAFSAMIWLPIYVTLFNRLRRKQVAS